MGNATVCRGADELFVSALIMAFAAAAVCSFFHSLCHLSSLDQQVRGR